MGRTIFLFTHSRIKTPTMSLLFIMFYLVITANAFSDISQVGNITSKLDCYFTKEWTVRIHNQLKDPIIVHVK